MWFQNELSSLAEVSLHLNKRNLRVLEFKVAVSEVDNDDDRIWN